MLTSFSADLAEQSCYVKSSLVENDGFLLIQTRMLTRVFWLRRCPLDIPSFRTKCSRGFVQSLEEVTVAGALYT